MTILFAVMALAGCCCSSVEYHRQWFPGPCFWSDWDYYEGWGPGFSYSRYPVATRQCEQSEIGGK